MLSPVLYENVDGQTVHRKRTPAWFFWWASKLRFTAKTDGHWLHWNMFKMFLKLKIYKVFKHFEKWTLREIENTVVNCEKHGENEGKARATVWVSRTDWLCLGGQQRKCLEIWAFLERVAYQNIAASCVRDENKELSLCVLSTDRTKQVALLTIGDVYHVAASCIRDGNKGLTVISLALWSRIKIVTNILRNMLYILLFHIYYYFIYNIIFV